MPTLYRSALILLFLAGFSFQAVSQKIYWAENTNVRVADLTPTGVTNVTALLTFSGVRNITIDQFGGFIYYSETESVQRASLANGSGQVEIINKNAMSGYQDIAFSSSEGNIYGTGVGGDDGAYLLDVANGTDATLIMDFGGTPKGSYDYLGVDAWDGNEIIYFANISDNRIYGTDLSGSSIDIDQVIVPQVGNVEYLAVDEFANKLYYSTYQSLTYRLFCYDLNTSTTSSVLVSTSNRISSIQPYGQFGKVFFVEEGAGIFSINLDGTAKTQIVSSADITDIAVAIDVVNPAFNALSPVDGATNVVVTTGLSMTFTEPIKKSTVTGTANETSIRIYKVGVATPVETIDRTNAAISISGNTVSINPTNDLLASSDYYILAGSKVITDLSGNAWVGISAATAWNFTTEVDVTKFYSRQSGDWNNVNTWSHISHSGAVATTAPTGSGDDVWIGSGHTVKLVATTSVLAQSNGLEIESGGTLNADGQILKIAGRFAVAGTFSNAGEVQSYFCGAQIYNTSGTLLIFDRLVVNHGCGSGTVTLNTDIVVMNGVSIITGTLTKNGFNVCDASMAPPVSPVVSNKKSTSITLGWSAGAADAFVVARVGSTNFEPSFGAVYGASSSFGSGTTVGPGNFVIYKGTSTSVDITNLLPATDYEFDLYSYNTTVGGCYSKTNYQFFQVTTCPNVDAPTNPVAAGYCTGSPTVAVKVDNPGAGKRIDWYTGYTGSVFATGSATGAGKELFTPTAAGTFYAELVDVASGCASATRTPVTLTMNPLPTTSNQTPTQCESTPGSGTATAINLTTYDAAVSNNVAGTGVSWFTNAGLSSPVATSTTASSSNGTIFYAKVTNTTTTCSKAATVTFTINALPTTTLSGLLTPCANAKNVAYQATAGATTFTWTVPIGATIASGQGTNSILVNFGTIGGPIKVVPSNGPGCDGTADQKTITIDPLPSAFAVRGGGTYCPGGNGVVVSLNNSTSGIRYEIYRGTTLDNFLLSSGGAVDFPPITQAGVYTVKATTPSNCNADMAGSATVTLGILPSGTGAITGITKICAGKESTYTISGISSAVDYQWTLPNGITRVTQATNSITVLAAPGGNGGTISVLGNNECGKGGLTKLEVTVSTPPSVSVDLPSAPIVINDSREYNATSAGKVESIEWNFGDNGTASGESTSHSYVAAGNYTVIIVAKDILGCESTDRKTITVISEPGLSDNSIKNAITTNGDGMNDVLFIERIEKFLDNEVIILDRWGTEVFRIKGYNNDWDFKKNGEYLPAGNYVCIVKLNESGKVIKRTITVIKGK